MAELNISSATTTDLKNQVPDFIVESMSLDAADKNQKESYWYFADAVERWSYYLTIPEIYSAANSLATWTTHRGYKAMSAQIGIQLERIIGMGKDNFISLMWNHEVTKLVIGDAFLEIIRNKKGTLVNMIPHSPERIREVLDNNGMIKRYDVWDGAEWKPIKKENMLHSHNKRIGDQVHGTSQIQPSKNVIDTLNEAREDERIIKHRDKALGIVYYKTDKAGKISYANSQIEKAVKNGDMVGLPEDTAKIEPWPSKSSEDRQNWIQYNENFFYQVFGVPRSIATSDGTTEVGGINGHLIFEPVYVKEQLDLENDLLFQQGIEIKWNRPPSLAPKAQENAEANTGQTSIQPGEAEPKVNR